MTATISVYKLPQVVNLTMAPTSGAILMNYSATRSDYTVAKGITTEIHFFVKNTDREPILFSNGETLQVVITDVKRTRTLLTKTLVQVDPARSIWKMTLSKEEIADWPLTTLGYSVVVNRGDDTVMLYLDRSFSGYSELLVVAGPYAEPRQPEEFAPADFLLRDGLAYSGAVIASVSPDFPQTAFSTAFYATEFNGRVSIQATLDEQPDAEDEMWFEVAAHETAEETNGLIPLNALGAYSWLRFVVRADSGSVTKIILQR